MSPADGLAPAFVGRRCLEAALSPLCMRLGYLPCNKGCHECELASEAVGVSREGVSRGRMWA